MAQSFKLPVLLPPTRLTPTSMSLPFPSALTADGIGQPKFSQKNLTHAHDRIHMLLLPQFLYKLGLSDRGFGCRGLSFDCQTNVLRMSRTQGSVTNSFFRESPPTCTSVSPHLYCADCSKTVSPRASYIQREACFCRPTTGRAEGTP
jgi:hypothetical protein